MGFSTPSAFWLALLVLPITALYLLKVRSRRVTVSTGVFWDDSLLVGQKPFPGKSLRHWVSLLLQICLLILIVLSIADPYILSHRRAARRMVLVIDNSASMRATDVRPSRLEAAQEAAIALIDGMNSEDEAAVLTAGRNPQVVAGMATDTAALQKAVKSITFSDGSSHAEAAVSFSEKLIGRHPHGEVILLTDGCIPDLRSAHTVQELRIEEPDNESPKADRSPPVVLRVFGTEASNVGITQFQVRRSYADPTGYQVFLSVRNASSTSVRCRVVLTMDNVPVDVIPLSLSPEEQWTRSLEKVSSEGGVIRAALNEFQTEDSAVSSLCNQLLTDDEAWAILPTRKVQKVHVVTKGNLFLEKVFEANPLADLTSSTTLLQRSSVVPDEILVLHKEIPEQLPSGPLFVINPKGNCDLWEDEGSVTEVIVDEQVSESPLMRHLRLEMTQISEARQLRFRSPPNVLAKSREGTVLFAMVDRPEGKCLVLNVDLDRSDLPFRTVFPVLISNALAWFSGESSLPEESVSASDVALVAMQNQLKFGATVRRLQSPSGRLLTSSSATKDLNESILTPFKETGIWSMFGTTASVSKQSSTDASPRNNVLSRFAVNLTEARETDLRPRSDLRLSESEIPEASEQTSLPIRYYLILMALALTLIEYRRHVSV